MRSLLYWHPSSYHFIMQQLYGKDFNTRYEKIASLIPAKAEVVELCMGDAYLYRKYLSVKKVSYLGLDVNETFVHAAEKKNIPAKFFNILYDEIPAADYIIMQAGLYHFIPDEKKIIQKMLNASRKFVLISEPVNNRAHSKNPLVSFIAKYGANPGTGQALHRFDEKSAMECFRSFKEFREDMTVKAGKEIAGVFAK